MNKGSDCKAHSTLGIWTLFFQSSFCHLTDIDIQSNLLIYLQDFFYFMCVKIFVCMPAYHVHVSAHGEQKRAADPPGTGVTDTCNLSCGLWESNPRPLEEQSMLVTTEPSP